MWRRNIFMAYICLQCSWLLTNALSYLLQMVRVFKQKNKHINSEDITFRKKRNPYRNTLLIGIIYCKMILHNKFIIDGVWTNLHSYSYSRGIQNCPGLIVLPFTLYIRVECYCLVNRHVNFYIHPTIQLIRYSYGLYFVLMRMKCMNLSCWFQVCCSKQLKK